MSTLMKMLLASFAISSLVFAGCNTATDDVEVEDDATVVEDESTETVDADDATVDVEVDAE